MESSYWLKLGFIAALFLGAFYVLLPTILQEDADRQIAGQLASTSVGTARVVVDNKLRYTIDGADGAAMVTAVRDRLELLKVTAARIDIDDDERLLIVRAAGVSIDDVTGALEAQAATLGLVPLSAFIEMSSPDTAAALLAMPEVASLRGQKANSEDAIATAVRRQNSAGALELDGVPTVQHLLLTLDGVVQGAVIVRASGSTNDDGTVALTDRADVATFGAGKALRQALELKPLPGTLERVLKVDTVAVADSAVVEPVESAIPEWVSSLLPDTRMPLGLDLQGGIDLTLEVELDEALLSQAKRDTTYLVDQASKQDLVLQEVKRARAEAVILIRSEAGLGDVSGFMASQFQGSYQYLDDITDKNNVGWHRFGMISSRKEEIKDQAVEQVLDVLRRRVADTGVRDPVVVRKGGGKISVQLPGLDDTSAAQNAIGRTAMLHFRLVDHEFGERLPQQLFDKAFDAVPADQRMDDMMLNRWLWDQGDLPEDRVLLSRWEDIEDKETGEITHRRVGMPLVLEPVVLTGNDINDASAGTDQMQGWLVHLSFKPQGANTFCTITTERVGKQFAIVLDNEVQSAPNINERICGGRAQISMNNDMSAADDAKSLAVVLRTGALNAPVSIGGVRQIGPSLGADAIRSGSFATVLGGLVVLLFMALWYRLPGLIANVALVLNVMLVLAGLSLFGWTLTLSGIAGIALTIGMAVDANIIIYERIREEMRLGQHARKAVEVGFQKGAVTVLDANITTAIAGVVLFSYGNITIQGFAVTLLIGIGTTLVTALFVTRTLLEIVTRSSTARLRI